MLRRKRDVLRLFSKKSRKPQSLDLLLILDTSHLQRKLHSRSSLSQLLLHSTQLLLSLVEPASQVEVLVTDKNEVVTEELYLSGKTVEEPHKVLLVRSALEDPNPAQDRRDRCEDVLPAVQHALN